MNRGLADTADASARAAGNRLQTQAARTGQNPAGAIAATERMQQENERTLAGQTAAADTERINSEAGYDKGALQATALPVGMEEGVAKGYEGLFGTSLGAQGHAAETPSFGDVLGDAFAKSFGSGVGSFLSPVKGGG